MLLLVSCFQPRCSIQHMASHPFEAMHTCLAASTNDPMLYSRVSQWAIPHQCASIAMSQGHLSQAGPHTSRRFLRGAACVQPAALASQASALSASAWTAAISGTCAGSSAASCTALTTPSPVHAPLESDSSGTPAVLGAVHAASEMTIFIRLRLSRSTGPRLWYISDWMLDCWLESVQA